MMSLVHFLTLHLLQVWLRLDMVRQKTCTQVKNIRIMTEDRMFFFCHPQVLITFTFRLKPTNFLLLAIGLASDFF